MQDFKFDDYRLRLKPGWDSSRMLVRGKLTDRQIERYRKKGYYSVDYRQARRDRMRAKMAKREGSFLIEEGRLIYSPK